MTENPNDPERRLDDRRQATPVGSEILAIISHELRTPLAAIKGYASTLKRQSQRLGRSEREEFLQAIDDASSRLDVLITRLLEWSQLELESGTLPFHLVPDSGIGIPGEHLQSIFLGFHPVNTQPTRNVAGIGLGLGIAKRIVEHQGGAMWAESEPGVGSVFSIALPLIHPTE